MHFLANAHLGRFFRNGGCAMRDNVVVPFPTHRRVRPSKSQGEVLIFPCCDDGGSWGVERVSRSGDSAAFIGSFFSLDQATAAAREVAAKTGADFLEGFGGAA